MTWVIEWLDERPTPKQHSFACHENMNYFVKRRAGNKTPMALIEDEPPYFGIDPIDLNVEGCRCHANGDGWTRISNACWRDNWPNPWRQMKPDTLENCVIFLRDAPHHNSTYRLRNTLTDEIIPALIMGY